MHILLYSDFYFILSEVILNAFQEDIEQHVKSKYESMSNAFDVKWLLWLRYFWGNDDSSLVATILETDKEEDEKS